MTSPGADLPTSPDPSLRILVLMDLKVNKSIWAFVSHGYDAPEDPQLVTALFDDTFAHLSAAPHVAQSPQCPLRVEELPILRGIGRYSETILKKYTTGDVQIAEAGKPARLSEKFGFG